MGRWKNIVDWATDIDWSETGSAVAAGAATGATVGAVGGAGAFSWLTGPVGSAIGAGVGLIGSLKDDVERLGKDSTSYYAQKPINPIQSDGFPVTGQAVLNGVFVSDLLIQIEKYVYKSGDMPLLLQKMMTAKKRGVRFSLDDQAKTELAVGLEKLREPSEVDWSGMIEVGTQFLSKWGAE